MEGEGANIDKAAESLSDVLWEESEDLYKVVIEYEPGEAPLDSLESATEEEAHTTEK